MKVLQARPQQVTDGLKILGYYLLAIIWFFPILWMIGKSFVPTSEILAQASKLFPTTFTLENFREVVSKWPFLRWLLNSLIVTTGAVGVSVVVSIFAAYSFARLRWRGRDVIFVIFLTSMFIPWEINAIPLYFIANKLELLNSYPGIFLPISAMPVGMFLLRQFFINIPQDVEDAARIDGCSSLGVLLRILLPMALPALGALVIFMFLFTWNEFFWSLICLQRSKMLTLPIGLKTIMGAHNVQYGILFGASLLSMLPSLIVFLILRRQIIKGITIGGIVK
jgi:ABC-type glycerol-3-phosphate transport system permease component